MDVHSLLHQDHETVRFIFEDLEESPEWAVRKREILFQELNVEWTVHALAEEKFLYPLLEAQEATRRLAREAAEEHRVVGRLLKELELGEKGGGEWLAKLKVLKENVERHFDLEERELFRLARTIIDADQAGRLAASIEAYKEEQLHTLEI